MATAKGTFMILEKNIVSVVLACNNYELSVLMVPQKNYCSY
jgi:cobalamin-dependent methionine synthase I